MHSKESSFYCKYLQIDRSDKEWQVYLTSSGRQTAFPGDIYPIHQEVIPSKYEASLWEEGRVFNEYALIYITKGSGKFKSGTQEIQRIEPGTMFMLFPGVRHWYEPDCKTGWHEYWIGFDGNYPGLLVEKGFFSPERAVFNVGLNEEIVEIFQEVIELTRRDTDIFQPKLGACIIELLALLLDKSRDNKQNSEEIKLIENAKILFKENIFNTLNMQIFADDLGMNHDRFRKIFKNCTGYSPYQYFLKLKIDEAKHLLEDGYYSIKEIAYQLDFENQYYFSRIFKNKTGYSPRNWVNRQKKPLGFISAQTLY